MLRIIKIGMDVHTTNYTLCAIEPVLGEDEHVIMTLDTTPECNSIIKFIEQLKNKLGTDNEYDIECGYEAGCLGYSLYKQLTEKGIKCTILAPSTMLTTKGKRIKTDSRDALVIAQCLAYKGYSSVYITDEEDQRVRSYIRMRNDHKDTLKRVKQQINAFCLSLGHCYDRVLWTAGHLLWLRNLELSQMDREILDEYYATYEELTAKIERFDKRIEEIAQEERYRESVKRLICFKGIKVHTAMSLIVETGDFKRFKKGSAFAAYLGLVPGECSSGENINRTPITKAGNAHLRTLLVEAAQGIVKGKTGYKSKELRKRQSGNPAHIIGFADKANERLKRKFHRMQARGKKYNVAVTAVARELAGFVWGMMTDNTELTQNTATANVSQG